MYLQSFFDIRWPQTLFEAFVALVLEGVIIILESGIIFAVHSTLSWIRPAARDRNLVGQGFADPNHPGL